MARPTTYNPEFCDLVIEYGKQGKSITWMAAELDVTRETIYEWMRVHPEFSDAITRSRQHAQRWWEDAGQNGMVGPGFNASVWSRSMAARFPEEWRENKGVELTGAGGGPVQHVARIELVALGADSTDRPSA
jgi:hypothetical protein